MKNGDSTLLDRKQDVSRAMLPHGTNSSDDFQSPPEALDPLYCYLSRETPIWECACGEGNLVRALVERGFTAWGTDIKGSPPVDFLTREPDAPCVIVTNPPYSLKDEFLLRCYDLGYPFALLMPLTALEGRRRTALYRQNGIELILFPKRINFTPPRAKGSGSWFATAWFTHGLGIGSALTFWEPAGAQATLEFAAGERGG